MKRIKYAGSEFVTGDEIAAALLHYSAALADAGAAEAFDIPVARTDGSRGVATVLAGPASQIVAEEDDSGLEELVDPDIVQRLRARARELRPVAQPSERPEYSEWREEY